MKSESVKVGGCYSAKVSGRVVPVRIVRKHISCGWIAENMLTRRTVMIRSARRLHEKGVAK